MSAKVTVLVGFLSCAGLSIAVMLLCVWISFATLRTFFAVLNPISNASYAAAATLPFLIFAAGAIKLTPAIRSAFRWTVANLVIALFAAFPMIVIIPLLAIRFAPANAATPQIGIALENMKWMDYGTQVAFVARLRPTGVLNRVTKFRLSVDSVNHDHGYLVDHSLADSGFVVALRDASGFVYQDERTGAPVPVQGGAVVLPFRASRIDPLAEPPSSISVSVNDPVSGLTSHYDLPFPSASR